MARKDRKTVRDSKAIKNGNSSLNNIAQKILALVDTNYEYTSDLESKNLKFQQVINREIDLANGVSHGSILDFIQSQRESNKKTTGNQMPMANNSNLFTENIDQVYNYLMELYDNKYMEMADLRYICKFIPVLGKAVKTTLDHLTASDEVADTVKRKITFDTTIDEKIKTTIIDKIEELETEHKLLKKIKNFTFRDALTVGSGYIYCIPFKDLFEQYMTQKKENESKNESVKRYFSAAKESVEGVYEVPIQVQYEKEAISIATEAVSSIVSSIPGEIFKDEITKSAFSKNSIAEAEDIVKSFSFTSGSILDVAMEEATAFFNVKEQYGQIRAKKAEKKKEKENLQSGFNNQIPDGTKDIKMTANEETDLINMGCYLKFISAKDLVPFDVFGEVIGYYHVVSKRKKKSIGRVSTFNSEGLFTSALDMAKQKKEMAVDNIVDAISDMIVNNFGHKFLVEHKEFKKTIADCIIAKGIVDNDYNIQFIPAKYIHAFKINETIEGQGESMLADSLLSGKMLLSYLVSKLLLFVNNAGDKTLVTTHKGPIDLNGKNQLDRVVRQLEGGNISFGDFMAPNIMFNKFNRNANILVPTANNGNKLLEFERLEGKDLNMQTEMEEKLEKMAIIGTSVPDTIMEYVNDLQFSRQVISSSIQYAGFVGSLQIDLEEPMTDLYHDLLYNSNLNEECRNAIPHVHIELPRPKVLANTNNGENVRVAKELADIIAELYYGTEVKPEDVKAKAAFVLETCKELLTFYDWAEADARKNKIDAQHHEPKNPMSDTGQM